MDDDDPLREWAETNTSSRFTVEIRVIDGRGKVLATAQHEDPSFEELVQYSLPAELRRLGKTNYANVAYFAVTINVELTTTLKHRKPATGPRAVSDRSGPVIRYSDRKKKP